MGVLFPTSATVRPVNPILSDMLVGWMQSQDQFIADRVCKPIKVAERTGTILTVGRASTFGDVSDKLKRGNKSSYHKSPGVQLSSTTYFAEEYGDTAVCSRQDLDDSPDPLKLQEIESQAVLQNILIAKEQRLAAKMFDTSAFTTVTLAGADQWSTSTGDPVSNIEAARKAVHSRCGILPNAIVLGAPAYWAIRKSAAILSYMGTQKDRLLVTDEALKLMLKDYFKFEIVEFGLGLANSANQGQTFASSDIWGDYVWVGVLAGEGIAARSSVSVKPTSVAQFEYQPLVSEEYEDNDTRCLNTRHRHLVDEVVIDALAGQIIADTAA